MCRRPSWSWPWQPVTASCPSPGACSSSGYAYIGGSASGVHLVRPCCRPAAVSLITCSATSVHRGLVLTHVLPSLRFLNTCSRHIRTCNRNNIGNRVSYPGLPDKCAPSPLNQFLGLDTQAYAPFLGGVMDI